MIVGGSLFFAIVLLNLLIALMGDRFAAIKSRDTLELQLLRAGMVREIEFNMTIKTSKYGHTTNTHSHTHTLGPAHKHSHTRAQFHSQNYMCAWNWTYAHIGLQLNYSSHILNFIAYYCMPSAEMYSQNILNIILKLFSKANAECNVCFIVHNLEAISVTGETWNRSRSL